MKQGLDHKGRDKHRPSGLSLGVLISLDQHGGCSHTKGKAGPAGEGHVDSLGVGGLLNTEAGKGVIYELLQFANIY